jgi:ABC-type antimicrobial peptide transport system permease subunit
LEVVGLASNTKEVGLDEIAFNDIYLPLAQSPPRSVYLAAKIHQSPEAIVAALRRDLGALDAGGALYDVTTMEQRIDGDLRGVRFNLTLVLTFAALAALLAGVGVYGAIGFAVAQRTPEFGLRMALGAAPLAILRLTVMRTAGLTLAGTGSGLMLAVILGTLLKKALYLAPGEHAGMLYGVGIHDPASLAGAGIIMLGLAAVACAIPAIRAAKVDPLAALRHE